MKPKPLLAAIILAVAAPAPAAGAGLSLASRDLNGSKAVRVERFDLVGLHWRGSGSVLFRTRALGGQWSAWHPAAPEADDRPDRGKEHSGALAGWQLGSPYWTGGAELLQYRTVGRVGRVRAYFVRSPGAVAPVHTRIPQLAEKPTIITRAQWGASEAIRRAPPRYADNVHFAIVHHTAGSNSYKASQSAAIVRGIELYHVKANGWNDIGYNFLVDKYGQIFEGRYGGVTRAVIGAHAMGFNTRSTGVALLGNYDSASVTPAAKAALVSLLAWRLDLAHVDPLSKVTRISGGNPRYPVGRALTLRAIAGHRDTYPTGCPGKRLYALLPAIRTAVANTGLPKLYNPVVSGGLRGPVRFTARLSASADWTVTVRDQEGNQVASGTGEGTAVDWTWDASTAALDQRYTWTIAAPDTRSATGAIGTLLPAPTLRQVKVTPALVTPNGDGRTDTAKLTYRLNTQAIVTATLLDESNRVVTMLFRTLRPAGARTFAWSNIGVPDGLYRISLVARNSAGKQVQASIPVSVDRTLAGFAANAPAISPNGDGRLDGLTFGFRLLAPASVQLEILSKGLVAASVFEGVLAAGTQQVTWDGSGLPDGSYRALLRATDSLMTVKQSVVVRVDRKAPVLRLASFRQLRFWLSEPAKLTLTLNGRAYEVTRKRGGYFRIGHRGRVKALTAVAVDAAGNRSALVRARR
jgi:N-acetylmuramoyl-L-alanine amidase